MRKDKKKVPKKKTVQRTQGKKTELIGRMTDAFRLELSKKKRNESPVRSEYRHNNDTSHMTYVYYDDGKNLHSVGFTSKDSTFGIKNMPLQVNPKRNDVDPNRKSHIRNGTIVKDKKSYSRKKAKNYQISQVDMPNVKSKIRNAKKQRRKGGK